MRILILNSTHTKYPVGNEKWIQETIRAIRDFSADGLMICSLNPLQWDLAAYCCSEAGCDVDMLIPHCEENGAVDYTESVKGDFVFGPESLYIHYYNNGNKSGTKSAWQNRDDMAIASADIIVPVSLRPKGRLMTRLHENIRGKRIVTDYHVPWTKSQSRPRYDFQGYTINNLPPGDWLIHWTRASQGYWPGESKAEFWCDVLADPDRYVRSAGDTLLNIIREGLIRGSSWKMPGCRKAVSLSALKISEALGLMKWRKRFVRYTFEPYGIAMRKEAVVAQGGQEVRYERAAPGTPPDDHIFYQSPGTRGDWPVEREWRVPDDIDLTIVDKQDIIAIVPNGNTLKWVDENLPPHIDIRTITIDTSH